jgi:hypothetical protein
MDSQIGRFLGIDPLADDGGQQTLSPYLAMGANPACNVDPLGLKFATLQENVEGGLPMVGEMCEGEFVTLDGGAQSRWNKISHAGARALACANKQPYCCIFVPRAKPKSQRNVPMFFDNLVVKMQLATLFEKWHKHPYGLPIQGFVP